MEIDNSLFIFTHLAEIILERDFFVDLLISKQSIYWFVFEAWSLCFMCFLINLFYVFLRTIFPLLYLPITLFGSLIVLFKLIIPLLNPLLIPLCLCQLLLRLIYLTGMTAQPLVFYKASLCICCDTSFILFIFMFVIIDLFFWVNFFMRILVFKGDWQVKFQLGHQGTLSHVRRLVLSRF